MAWIFLRLIDLGWGLKLQQHSQVWIFSTSFLLSFPNPHPRIYLEKGRERGRQTGRRKGRGISKWERNIHSCLQYPLCPGIKSATWECILARNQSHELLVEGMKLHQRSHPARAPRWFFGKPRWRMTVEGAGDEQHCKFLYITHFVVNRSFWFYFYRVGSFDCNFLKL